MNKILRRMSIRFIPIWVAFKVKIRIYYLKFIGKSNREIIDILNADFERKIEEIRSRI